MGARLPGDAQLSHIPIRASIFHLVIHGSLSTRRTHRLDAGRWSHSSRPSNPSRPVTRSHALARCGKAWTELERSAHRDDSCAYGYGGAPVVCPGAVSP